MVRSEDKTAKMEPSPEQRKGLRGRGESSTLRESRCPSAPVQERARDEINDALAMVVSSTAEAGQVGSGLVLTSGFEGAKANYQIA